MIRFRGFPALFIFILALIVTANPPAFGFEYVIHHCPGGICNVPVYPVPAIPRPAKLKENPRIWLIAHTHCPQAEGVNKDYWAEAFATINKKGTKIFWGSNWDNPGSDTPIDAYQVTLPQHWYQYLSGSPPGSHKGKSQPWMFLLINDDKL